MGSKDSGLERSLFPPDKKEVITRKMEKFYLPTHLDTFIESFVEGRRSDSVLFCCHSDCTVCNQTILECIHEIRKDLGIV